ncbi:unnamed protein product, partial [Brenthis ino]
MQPKRMRMRQPSNPRLSPSGATSPPPSVSPPPSPSVAPSSPTSSCSVPSPGMFVECSPPSASNPLPDSPMQHPSQPPRLHPRHRRDKDINYGSEDDSDKSDDEDALGFSGIPRVLQSIMETPLDLDEDAAGEPTSAQGADMGGSDPEPASDHAPADVPPTATDQPWSWEKNKDGIPSHVKSLNHYHTNDGYLFKSRIAASASCNKRHFIMDRNEKHPRTRGGPRRRMLVRVGRGGSPPVVEEVPVVAGPSRVRGRGRARVSRTIARRQRPGPLNVHEPSPSVATPPSSISMDKTMKRRRGRANARHERPGPHTIHEFVIRDIGELPEDRGLETALHPKRMRTRQSFVVCSPPSASNPLPDSLMQHPSPPKRPHPRHRRDKDINCGSENDSDKSDDEGVLAFSGIPRTASDAWKRLSDTFEDKGLYRRVLLLRQLHRIEFNNFSSMSDYIEGVMKLVAQLSDIGKVIDDAEIAEILLSGLPEDFNVLVSSLETASLTKTLSSEVVRTRLLQEDHRRNNNGNTSENLAYAANNKRRFKNLVCTYCRKSNHTIKQCFKRKRDEAKKKNEDQHTLFATAYSTSHLNEFIIDSGATAHMCADSTLVQDPVNKKCAITVANGQQLQCEMVGKTTLSDNVSLSNVLFVPDLSNNLISVSEITNKGYVVTFHKDYCTIYSDCKITGNQVLFANKNNGLYKFKLQDRPNPRVGHSMSLQSRQGTMSANAAACVPISIWHKRLGHLNHKGMCILGDGNQCVGVVFQHENDVPGSCVSCLTGKMHESSYPRSSGGRAAHPLDLIHSDEDLRLPYEAQIGNGTTSLPLQSPLSDVYRTASEDSTEDDDDEAEVLSGSDVSLSPSLSRGAEQTASNGNDVSISRPVRSTRGIIPERYKDYYLSSLLADVSSLDEPSTYDEAMNSPEKDEWLKAMRTFPHKIELPILCVKYLLKLLFSTFCDFFIAHE